MTPDRVCPKCGSRNIYCDEFQLKCMDCGHKEIYPLTVDDEHANVKEESQS